MPVSPTVASSLKSRAVSEKAATGCVHNCGRWELMHCFPVDQRISVTEKRLVHRYSYLPECLGCVTWSTGTVTCRCLWGVLLGPQVQLPACVTRSTRFAPQVHAVTCRCVTLSTKFCPQLLFGVFGCSYLVFGGWSKRLAHI